MHYFYYFNLKIIYYSRSYSHQ
uniref:Uncharacterized protein n=1 Tax=Rhizophora mucronata TaxID=61149 RepID=A0A2P2QQD5_RHIMU